MSRTFEHQLLIVDLHIPLVKALQAFCGSFILKTVNNNVPILPCNADHLFKHGKRMACVIDGVTNVAHIEAPVAIASHQVFSGHGGGRTT